MSRKGMPTACREALSRLPELDLSELRQQWRALYKAEPSPHLSRELLVGAVAYRMQEIALGGLHPEPQRQLSHFAQQLKIGGQIRIHARPDLVSSNPLPSTEESAANLGVPRVKVQPVADVTTTLLLGVAISWPSERLPQ
jgi:hypothetical protein